MSRLSKAAKKVTNNLVPATAIAGAFGPGMLGSLGMGLGTGGSAELIKRTALGASSSGAPAVDPSDVNGLTRQKLQDPNAAVSDLIAIYRGVNNGRNGYDTSLNAQAGQRLAEMAGVDPSIVGSMADQELVQAIQGRGEQKKIEDLAQKQQGQINAFADDFSTRAKTKREELAAALAKNNQSAFEMENPFILEDLNSRGLFRSPTAVNSAQADALKELELDRSNKLLAFDTSAFGDESDIRSGGLSNLIGGDQSALDTALNARRSGLEMAYNKSMADQEQSLADSLAKKKRRADLTNSLISGGASIISAAIPKPK